MGDLLFALANLSRKLGIEPEAALRKANDKFTRRFERLERRLAASWKESRRVNAEEMETEWRKIKDAE